ncbi:MAG TPA: toll/interleukin-1 receptor domain-containing protein [Geminicoccaceae bacterium]|nr:toll/interleukin-1 receptor domain-containing protein [Geminicoccaceae bacterium]
MSRRPERRRTPTRLVFISHSGRNTWIARQIARAIETHGATAFLDEAEIDAGADFEDEILAALEKADELLVLLTPWAVDRPYIWAEIGAAWFRRIPIVVLLHGITASELRSRPGVPVLTRRNLLDLNDVDLYLTQLRRRASQTVRADPGSEDEKP